MCKTRKPFPSTKVAKILGCVVPISRNNCLIKSKFTPKQLNQLLQAGAVDLNEAQNDGPNIREFQKFFKGKTYPILFLGYAVFPPREDARITIEGFEASDLFEEELMQVVNAFHHADKFWLANKGHNVWAWWD